MSQSDWPFAIGLQDTTMRADLLNLNENAKSVQDLVAEVKRFESAQKANRLNKNRGTNTLDETQTN